ncbi:MAG: hypothetical protein WD314_08340 [Trueperaceae bacterium]
MLGHAFPLLYANNLIQEVVSAGGSVSQAWPNMLVLACYGLLLLLLASLTLREVE